KIHAICSKFADGTDSTTCITLEFPGSKFAQLTSSFEMKLGNEVTIYGDKGLLRILEPLLMPTKIITPEGAKDFPLPQSDAVLNFPNSNGFTYEATHVRNCITEG
ncbi:hypothetical protein, partial [Salmonella sp. s51228]|uniref:hypothetical protein n=1 Tax=Salmonella sp. s51228 TaxID=3159652 RepID=UPI00397F9438